IRVGAAKTDITPPLGIPLAGYYHERGADGVLDPLYSKAMVIEQDDQRAALVVLDLIGPGRWITDQARALVEQSTGIRGSHVMISPTHAHPARARATRGKRDQETGSKKEIAVKYTEQLPRRVAESVRLANERLQPVRLSVARGRWEGLAFNRRYFMQDG